jgi:acetyl-CoA synthetase
MSQSHGNIDALLSEQRVFEPPPAFAERALVSDRTIYERAETDPEGFWAEQAERLTWFRRWDTVMEWTPPWVRWFEGGQLNASYNCLDRHVEAGGGEKVAYHWEGEPGDRRTITYRDLYEETCRFANALRSLGVAKGDRVAIYLGMVPELPVAMLACARIGAAHSVVFGGFSAEALKDRINDAEAKVLITADGAYRRGQVVPLKQNAEDAVKDCPSIEHVVTVHRTGGEHPFVPGRDIWYHEMIADQPAECEPEPWRPRISSTCCTRAGPPASPRGSRTRPGGT